MRAKKDSDDFLFLDCCQVKKELIASFGKELEDLTDEEFVLVAAHTKSCEICKEANVVLDQILDKCRNDLKKLFPLPN
jgi:hypothetical protein